MTPETREDIETIGWVFFWVVLAFLGAAIFQYFGG